MKDILVRHRNLLSVAILAVAIAAVLSFSCTQSTPAARDGAAAGPPHAVHSADLQAAMRNINQRSQEDIAAELYTGNPTNPNMDDVAKSADAIAGVANNIPSLVAASQMDSADRAEIGRLASQLRESAVDLRNKARENNLAGVRSAMDRVNTTCTECHTRFRFGGA